MEIDKFNGDLYSEYNNMIHLQYVIDNLRCLKLQPSQAISLITQILRCLSHPIEIDYVLHEVEPLIFRDGGPNLTFKTINRTRETTKNII